MAVLRNKKGFTRKRDCVQDMKKKSVAINAIYQTLYNILATITPLITTPIISREMGAENLGIFSYTLTISHYFTIFAMLGVVNYGTRAIAESSKLEGETSRQFWSIYSVQFCMATVCNVIYILYVMLLVKDNVNVFFLQTFWVLGTLFNVNWYFFGLEEFRITVTRNIVIKLLTVVSIFLFVKEGHNPLTVYTLIMAGGNFLSIIVILPMLRGRLKWIRPTWEDIRVHIKPILILFIPLLAGVLFGSIDKVMLGGMSEYSQLGYYYNADRVINIPVGIINGLSTVLFPRISSMLANNKKKEGLIFISKSFEMTSWASVLLALGIAGCAKKFVPLFFGPGYEECVSLIYIMTPILIINAISIFYRMQYLVPFHHDRLYAIALFIGTIVNLILNAILIPQYKAVGASVATLIAQTVVMVIQFKEKEGVSLWKWITQLLQYLILGVLMFVAMRVISNLIISEFMALVSEIIIGGFVYLTLSLLYWKITGQLSEKLALVKRN